MKRVSELHSAGYYSRILRPLLPQEVFQPHSGQLWRGMIHIGIYIGGLLTLRHHNTTLWLGIICSLFMGHSLACCAFIAHDISHGSVKIKRKLRHLLGGFLWCLNGIPPTLWHQVHNRTHHTETNTLNDPDRRFTENERTPFLKTYSDIMLPGKKRGFSWLTIMGYFVPFYVIRHSLAALLPSNKKPIFVTAIPHYNRRLQFNIAAELLAIILLQLIIWHFAGESWTKYLLASPMALTAASAFAMLYIFTNHSLNPLCEHTDPVAGSTSVIVPKWMDWLHDNFSYHTEHHLFPGMNPKFYPLVSRLLKEHFPERYNRLTLGEAWRQLRQLDDFIQVDTLKPQPPELFR